MVKSWSVTPGITTKIDKVKLCSCGGHVSPGSGSTDAKSNLASADFGHKVANKGTHNFMSSLYLFVL